MNVTWITFSIVFPLLFWSPASEISQTMVALRLTAAFKDCPMYKYIVMFIVYDYDEYYLKKMQLTNTNGG